MFVADNGVKYFSKDQLYNFQLAGQFLGQTFGHLMRLSHDRWFFGIAKKFPKEYESCMRMAETFTGFGYILSAPANKKADFLLKEIISFQTKITRPYKEDARVRGNLQELVNLWLSHHGSNIRTADQFLEEIAQSRKLLKKIADATSFSTKPPPAPVVL